MTEYYRYTGDPAAIGIMTLTADYLLDYCQTPADHPWPNFIISTPVKGKAFGRANPHGFIQLDLCGQLGSALLAAYKVTGNPRYLSGRPPLGRPAGRALRPPARRGTVDPPRQAQDAPKDWSQKATAGVSLILQFLNDVIRLGYRGQGDSLVKARDAGENYLRDALLARWSNNPTFGHHFWDWDNPVYTCAVPGFAAQYMMDRREAFPQWKTRHPQFHVDVLLPLERRSGLGRRRLLGGVGLARGQQLLRQVAAIPDHAHCGPLARYAVLADDAWAREIARRQTILSTYDAHETGVVEDHIDGGVDGRRAVVQLGPSLALADGHGDARLAAGVFRPGPREPHHAHDLRGPQRPLRQGPHRLYHVRCPAPCEDVLRLAFTPDGRLGRRQALAAPAGRGGKRLHRQAAV